ncbi:AAA family ATPase [Gallaecimonas sp. GXIMD4217]|uniref:shikimate kinase n=1 Tax=Gallaecimonas sp. GXIMD4217 TaxID=3131927 RepID=UPI00311B00AB
MDSLVLFLFGKSGTGKSYIGDFIGEILGWYVYHADEDLIEEMKIALSESRPFTNDMRDRYFTIIAEKIMKLQKIHRRIVVTQGAYKRRHRDYLASNISDIELVYVQSSEALILKRLSDRTAGISASSAKALNQDFEQPSSQVNTIINNGSKSDIAKQLSAIAAAMPNKFSQQDAAKLRLC